MINIMSPIRTITRKSVNMVAELDNDTAPSRIPDTADCLEDLKAKDESQVAETRQTEATASHNFQMPQQSLKDEMKFNAQDLEATKHSFGEVQGQLTTDTSDLKMTEDALAEDTAALEDTTQDCLAIQAKVEDFEAYNKSLSEELEALAKAKAVISEKTGDAEYRDNRSVLSSRGSLASSLVKSENSIELVHLASRVASAMHAETSYGDDRFAKVKGLISDMIARLEEKASVGAIHKAFEAKHIFNSIHSEIEMMRDKIKLRVFPRMVKLHHCCVSFNNCFVVLLERRFSQVVRHS